MTSRIKEFINRGMMPLVGRDREMRALLDAFAGLLDGEPRSVWMAGPAGVGKSRLLDEIKELARDHAARSLVVHAKWYEGENIEFGPLSNALEVLRPALAAPLAARIFRDGMAASVDAAVEAVQIASRRYPVIIILDDLHYLDSSEELGRFVAALEEIPVLVIATTRPSDDQILRSFRMALAGSIPPLDMEIGPLDGAGIAEAARELFNSEPPEEMIGPIAALSAGVPLALREVFRELMAAEHLSQNGTGWKWNSAALNDDELRSIADRVHGFTGRLASLPAAERGLLALAGFLGEQFNRELLRHVAERTIGWDDHAFERLILAGFISVATPSIRLGAREQEGRVCFAFMHTLLWKAAAGLDAPGMPSRHELASITLDILTSGTGELYTILPLESLAGCELNDEQLHRLFDWIATVDRKLPPIYSEVFVTLCRLTLAHCRRMMGDGSLNAMLHDGYLKALTSYGERLYLTGAREQLHEVATEVAEILKTMIGKPPATTEERIMRLEAGVVISHDAVVQGKPESAQELLGELMKTLPAPAEQTDREMRAAAEAIRILAASSRARGEWAATLDVAAPYISEMDRMRPETLNALYKVLLYAMIRAERMTEAGEMIEAGLRLRREADLFTEYEILIHAANYARELNNISAVRQYATELRQLVDRYPAYRNLSTNYFHLPMLIAREGKPDELAHLEKEFRSTPPPARSSVLQTLIARHQFQQAWNMLGDTARAIAFADEIDPQITALSPLQQMRVAEERLRSCIDANAPETIPEVLATIDTLSQQVGGNYARTDTEAGRRVLILRLLANATSQDQPDDLRERMTEIQPGEIDDTDAFRAARMLLLAAERSAGRKREFNDAAYTAIDLALHSSQQEVSPGLAHHQLDRLAELLPKTRLMRFRQAIGPDPREQTTPSENGATTAGEAQETQKTMLRSFGALRVEGTDEGGAKLESKTRSLVASLVVAKLGDTRSLGELTRDRLADLLWPDMSIDRAVNNLHATLSYARRFLGGSDTITQNDGVYEINDDVAIDAVEFRECVTKGNRLHSEGVYFGAAAAYRNAIELATGDFLEGMYAEWVDSVRESLRGELATALERLIAIELDRDNYAAVPRLAEKLLALDDLHDGAYEALIKSAAARGARREAFSYFNRYEAALDTYGAGPARRITELMSKVRAGEA
jgi:DNA-binding SARP family transcriptional activator